MFGALIIVLAFLVSLLGYLVMPDDTKSANDGAIEIRKEGPGFAVEMLKVTKNQPIEHTGFFERMFFGKESKYRLVPIRTYELSEDSLTLEISLYHRGKSKVTEQFDLVDVVLPLKRQDDGKLYHLENSQVSGTAYSEGTGGGSQPFLLRKRELVSLLYENNIEKRTYLLGTDPAGRDVLSRLLLGTRISLGIGFVAVLISLGIGILVGAMAGFFRGWVDNVLTWLITVVWSIPGIMLVIAISLALGKGGVWVAFVAVGLTMWVDVARVVRGQILEVREQQFVEAARALGYGNARIIVKHILPNLVGPIIVVATANFAAAILIEAGLSFLGLGVQPPTPSWGLMVHDGYQLMTSPGSWYLLVFPALAISTLVFAFNLLGNGLRDAFDPKTKLG